MLPCQGLSHESNTCPKRRGVNICERCEEEEMIMELQEDIDTCEQVYPVTGEYVVCLLHRIFLTPKVDEHSQAHSNTTYSECKEH